MSSCYLPYKINPFVRVKTHPPVAVDGFRAIVEDIDAPIRASIADDKALFVLIVGQSGTGRTAAAKHVIDRFVELSGATPGKFVVPDIDMVHHDPMTLLGKWLQRLTRQATKFELIGSDSTLPQRVRTEVAQAQPGTFEDIYAGIVDSFATEMWRRDNGAFGALFENVLDIPLINAAKTMFEYARIPCIFTVEQSIGKAADIQAAFEAMSTPHHVRVELSYLSGEEVARFAEEHWLTCHPGEPGPFERAGVQEVFSDKLRPIGRARTLLGRLHNLKMRFGANEPPWSAKKLAENLPDILVEDRQ